MANRRLVIKDDANNCSYWNVDQSVLNDLSSGGVPSVSLYTLSRLHTGYQLNTNITALTQNVWSQFAFPSGGFITSGNSPDMRPSVDFVISPTETAFTYTGATPKWFTVSVVCNVFSDGGNDRSIQVQWRRNGVPIGFIRESYMRSSDALIITGTGDILLSTNDTLSPWIQNIENNDGARIATCSFNFIEDPGQILVTP